MIAYVCLVLLHREREREKERERDLDEQMGEMRHAPKIDESEM